MNTNLKRIGAVFLLLCCLGAAGCSKGTQEEAKTVRWIVSDLDTVPQKNIDEVNRLLSERGYDFTLQIVAVSDENYVQSVETYLESESADIIWGGFTVNETDQIIQLIDDGVLENLDSYFLSENGKTFFEYFDENCWQASRYRDGYYFIPNSAAGTCDEFYIEFNPVYVSKETVTQFDGSLEALQEVQSESGGFIQMESIRLLDISGYTGCTNLGGCLISDTTLRADLDAYDTVYNGMKILNRMYLDGILVYGEDENASDVAWEDCVAKICYGTPPDSGYFYSYGSANICNLASGGIGICAAGTQKEDAFELLRLITTDSEFANAILYGVEGTDYTVEGDLAFTVDGEIPNMFLAEWMLGCHAAACKTALDGYDEPRYDYACKYWEKIGTSPLLGFFFDSSDCKNEYSDVVAVTLNDFPSVACDDFETAWNDYIELLKTAGIESVIDELNTQLTSFVGAGGES